MIHEAVRGVIPDPGLFSLSGLELLRAFYRRLVPRTPVGHLVGHRITQVGSGSATVTLPASPWFQASRDLEYTIAVETALRAAILSTLPPATTARMTELSLHRFRPATVESETIIARARTLNTGPTLTVGEVFVEDALGRGVAHGTASARPEVVEPPPPAAPPLTGPVPSPAYPTPDPYLRPFPDGVDVWTRDIFDRYDGLTAMQMFLKGEAPCPPFVALLGLRFLDVGAGRTTAVVPASPWFCSLSREVTPGVLASLSFFCLTAAMLTIITPGSRLGVVRQHVDLLGGVEADGRDLVFETKVTHRAEDRVLAAVEGTGASGATVVVGQQSSVLLRDESRTGDNFRRQLLTVLFTDVVGSTEKAEELGDRRWAELLAHHDAIVRRQLEIHRGREVKTTGDGFLATFEAPARALRCAAAIRDAVRDLGLQLRAGIHTGECEVGGGDIGGIAVHIAARILALAEAGEILASATVCDLVSGSGIVFADRGVHELKGVAGARPLFAYDG